MPRKTKDNLMAKKLAKLYREIGYVRADTAGRLKATRRIFGRRVLAVDIHTHSTHSDGRDPVEENYAAAMSLGLDRIFATDHASLQQKRNVKKLPRAGWGQEPGCGGHHVGLLCNRRLFKPLGTDFARDFAAARRLAEFVWVPHPVGWYPRQRYDDRRIAQLWTLGRDFALEFINGANKIFRAYDEWDQRAVAVWDRLLADGRRITALGASDAHIAVDVGIAWTGVHADSAGTPGIIKALNSGRCFASEAPLLDLSLDNRPMGSEAVCKPGAVMRLRYRAADSGGIRCLTFVRDGRAICNVAGAGGALLDGVVEVRAGKRPGYVRMEVESADGRRAFSSPIYLTPRKN